MKRLIVTGIAALAVMVLAAGPANAVPRISLPGNSLGDGEQVIVGDKVSHPVGAGLLPGGEFLMQHD